MKSMLRPDAERSTPVPASLGAALQTPRWLCSLAGLALAAGALASIGSAAIHEAPGFAYATGLRDTTVVGPPSARSSAPDAEVLPTRRPEPRISAVAELIRRDGGEREVIDLISYPLPSEQTAFDWPGLTASAGGEHTGAARLAIPIMEQEPERPHGETTRFSISNVVWVPGFTDLAIVLYDQNGLLDFVCWKMNENQTGYIDLRTWGYVSPGFRGTAIVSAVFWEHEVFSAKGGFLHNLVGLAAVAASQPTDGTAGVSSGVAASPLYGQLGQELGPHMYGVSAPCQPPWRPPLRTPVPSETAIVTATATPTWTPSATPTSTATPLTAPIYCETSPAVYIPDLVGRGPPEACDVQIVVQNVGLSDSKVTLLAFGEPSGCDSPRGPIQAVCSGLIEPGTPWVLGLDDLSEEAVSAVVYSFNTRLRLIPRGPSSPLQHNAADLMCSALASTVGNEDDFLSFHRAYSAGWEYAEIIQEEAWGAPIVVQVRRSCVPGSNPVSRVVADYTGASGPALGYTGPDGAHTYAIPVLHPPQHGAPLTSIHVQNAGDECVTAALWVQPQDECGSLRAAATAEVAPGEAATWHAIELGIAVPSAGLVRATGPVAVVVDADAPIASGAHLAQRLDLRTLRGEPLLSDGNATAFAPIVYKNYEGWTTELHVQNTSDITTTLVATFYKRRDWPEPLARIQMGPLCPAGAITIDVETIAGIPYEWVGSARIESYPAAAGPITTPWTPAPTSTPEETVGPTDTPAPTDTPGTPPTPGGETPTATAPDATPSATPVVPSSPTPTSRCRVYLPAAQQGGTR